MPKRIVGSMLVASFFLLTGGFNLSVKGNPLQSWTQFDSKEGFSVLMPNQPARKISPTDTALGKIDLVMFTASGSSGFYGVVYSDFPFVPTSTEEINQLLDSGRDMGIANTKGKLLSENRITLDGYLGREIRARLDAGIFIARLYLVKQRLYQIIIVATESQVSSPDTTRFLNSFKLTAAREPAAVDPPARVTEEAAGWRELSSPKGSFRVLMPSKPEESSTPVDIPGGKTSMYFYASSTPEGATYMASFADMNLDLEGAGKVKVFLDAVREGQVTANKGNSLLSERDITIGGSPGREFIIDTPTGVTTSRVYLVGNRIYQLFFVKPLGFRDDEKTGQRFLDSFKLTNR